MLSKTELNLESGGKVTNYLMIYTADRNRM